MFSTLATGFAAWAAWKSPLRAADFAEQLRRDGERQSHKLQVFSTLMQERASIYSENGVRALNLIDVVFCDSREVREAWAELFLSYQAKNNIPPHGQQERLRKLLAAMAKNIGLSEQLRIDDFDRVYFPAAVEQTRLIENMERQEKMKKLNPPQLPASPTASLWPPKPE